VCLKLILRARSTRAFASEPTRSSTAVSTQASTVASTTALMGSSSCVAVSAPRTSPSVSTESCKDARATMSSFDRGAGAMRAGGDDSCSCGDGDKADESRHGDIACWRGDVYTGDEPTNATCAICLGEMPTAAAAVMAVAGTSAQVGHELGDENMDRNTNGDDEAVGAGVRVGDGDGDRGVVETPCGHRYHVRCIVAAVDSGGDSCPVCRRPMIEAFRAAERR